MDFLKRIWNAICEFFNDTPVVEEAPSATPNTQVFSETQSHANGSYWWCEMSRDEGTTTFKIFSGDDANIHDICEAGGSGVVSVASSVIPEIICKITDSCLDSNFELGLSYQKKSLKFIEMLF